MDFNKDYEQLNSFFKENIEFAFESMSRTYISCYAETINGVKFEYKYNFIFNFYNEQAYIVDRTPNYVGKLNIFVVQNHRCIKSFEKRYFKKEYDERKENQLSLIEIVEAYKSQLTQ